MYGIYKIEAEWDTNLAETLSEWIEKVGAETEKLISRHGTLEEAKRIIKIFENEETHFEYGDGRIYVRWYEIKIIDT